MLIQLLILISLILFTAIYAGSETAITSISKEKIDSLVKEKVKFSKTLKKIKQNPQELLITILVANNIINITASAYASYIFTEVFGSLGIGIATGVMTILLLSIGEIIPKTFANNHAISYALKTSHLLYLTKIILYPLVKVFTWITMFVNKNIRGAKKYPISEQELISMLKKSLLEGGIEKHEKEFVEKVFEFDDIEVKKVMTSKKKIIALDGELTLKQSLKFITNHPHTKFPVYLKNPENLIGIISVKKILQALHTEAPNKKLKSLELLNPTVFSDKKIHELLFEFQESHIHIALVKNKKNQIIGIVTLEDLMEEIVGELEDKFFFKSKI